MAQILGDLQVGRYTYHNPASLTADTVNDVRSYSSDEDIVKEKCTVSNPTKGGGTWVVVPGVGVMPNESQIPLVNTYTGNAAGATTQEELNKLFDAYSGGGGGTPKALKLITRNR